MKDFLKKYKAVILGIALFLILVLSLFTKVFGSEYEALDFNVRKGKCKLLKC